MDPIPFLIYAFTSVFTIVNPIGGMITFISLTEGMGAAERKKVAKRSVAIACILAIIFALVGELILRFYNVTVDALRVAGGILLFIVALNMLQARSSKVTQAELKDADQREDISVFPVATPLLTGPGAMTTVIVTIRTAQTVELKLVAIIAIILTFVVTYIFFRFSDRIHNVLGVTGSLVLTRVMGLLLAAIAVNFVSTGAWNIYMSFLLQDVGVM